jgi:acyl dehydratase
MSGDPSDSLMNSMKATPRSASGIQTPIFKTFEEADSIWFSTLSGDLNPLHMDASYAKLTPFGRPVLHGMAAVLEALGRWTSNIAQVNFVMRSIKIQFRKPLFWGVELELRTSAIVKNTFRLEWVRGESLYLRIEGQLSGSTAITPSASFDGYFPRRSARPVSSATERKEQFDISDFRYSIASDRLNDLRSSLSRTIPGGTTNSGLSLGKLFYWNGIPRDLRTSSGLHL